MPVLKILDQEGNEVENAQIQDGAQVNVIEKITINGDTIKIGSDKDINIDLDGKVDKVDGYGIIKESILNEKEDEFGLTPSGKIFQIEGKEADSFYNKNYIAKLRKIIESKVDKKDGFSLIKISDIQTAIGDGISGTSYKVVSEENGEERKFCSLSLFEELERKVRKASPEDIEGVFSNA